MFLSNIFRVCHGVDIGVCEPPPVVTQSERLVLGLTSVLLLLLLDALELRFASL
jgi:hypothetical protein